MIRLPLADLSAGEHVLPSAASHYLCRVLRRTVGDRFVAFDAAARLEADGEITDTTGEQTRVRLAAPRAAAVVAQANLVLVYALAKGDKVDDVVRDATELGATHVLVTQAARSVVKVSGERAKDKVDRWERIAEQAARQSGRADPPSVEGVLSWAAALDRAKALSTSRFCLDPRAAEPLASGLAPALERGDAVAFAIGPEGGLTADEIARATSEGFLPASLGPFVLRTETVAAAVLGAVRVLSKA